MGLPEWAAPPGEGYEHGDNYSALEVVWTHPNGHVLIQRPDGDRNEWYLDPAAGLVRHEQAPSLPSLIGLPERQAEVVQANREAAMTRHNAAQARIEQMGRDYQLHVASYGVNDQRVATPDEIAAMAERRWRLSHFASGVAIGAGAVFGGLGMAEIIVHLVR